MLIFQTWGVVKKPLFCFKIFPCEKWYYQSALNSEYSKYSTAAINIISFFFLQTLNILEVSSSDDIFYSCNIFYSILSKVIIYIMARPAMEATMIEHSLEYNLWNSIEYNKPVQYKNLTSVQEVLIKFVILTYYIKG